MATSGCQPDESAGPDEEIPVALPSLPEPEQDTAEEEELEPLPEPPDSWGLGFVKVTGKTCPSI